MSSKDGHVDLAAVARSAPAPVVYPVKLTVAGEELQPVI